MMKHKGFPSLDVRGLAQPLKNSPIPLSLHHQTLHLAQCSQAGNVLLESTKSPIRHPNRSVICQFTQYISTAPESSSVCFISLHPTPGIVLDVRLACSCSAMEIHSMKLPLHSFCADINASGSLKLFSYGVSRALVTPIL